MKFLFRLFICLLCLLPFRINAQYRYEIGLFGGVSNYIGDLAPDPVLKESHPAFGLCFKRNANGYFSYTLNANYGTISGNDSNNVNLKHRGLKFKSDIFELSGQIEFNFFKFGSDENMGISRFTPYVFTGLSYFHFDPTVNYKGSTYHLQTYATEGQSVVQGSPAPYQLWQFAIPVGAGFKFNLSEQFNLLVFAGYRGTFTSYLDDVGGKYVAKSQLISNKGDLSAYFSDPTNSGVSGQQRGNPDKFDWYIFSGITLSYIIPGPVCPKFN